MRYWMSFSDRGRFLGVVCAEADSPNQALALSLVAGCNPGGGVAILPINDRNLSLLKPIQARYMTEEMPLLTLMQQADFPPFMELTLAPARCLELSAMDGVAVCRGCNPVKGGQA